MSRFVSALLCSVCLASLSLMVAPHSAIAQSGVKPAPDPVIGQPSDKPQDAQETYDRTAIQQLMKVVELSRLIAGGVSQLYESAQGQKELLTGIHGAQTGKRDLLELRDTGERDGGQGLQEMSQSALNGAVQGPSGVVDALNKFRDKFKLDEAFQLKNDELRGKKLLAELAASSAVAGSTAENSYKRANASMQRLDGYITALKGSQDIKTSIDINTRSIIELAQQTNEAVRTQAAIASIVSAYVMMLTSEASEKDWVDGLKNFNR